MPEAVRFSVSLSGKLLAQFDDLLEQKGYNNRSEGIRDLIRDKLIQQEVEENKEVVGVITILYDHHVRELSERMIDEQHNSEASVISSMHVHLDHHNCLEVIVAQGEGRLIQEFSGRLIGIRGVKHGELVITSTGAEIPK